MTADNPQYDRVTCYFCLSEERHVLEEHHIVPRRFSGSDNDENLVQLCPTCHEKLERLYDERFYTELNRNWRPTLGDLLAVPPDAEEPNGRSRFNLKRIIADIEADLEDGAPIGLIIQHAVESGLPAADAIEAIEKLKQKGEVYEPTANHLRTT